MSFIQRKEVNLILNDCFRLYNVCLHGVEIKQDDYQEIISLLDITIVDKLQFFSKGIDVSSHPDLISYTQNVKKPINVLFNKLYNIILNVNKKHENMIKKSKRSEKVIYYGGEFDYKDDVHDSLTELLKRKMIVGLKITGISDLGSFVGYLSRESLFVEMNGEKIDVIPDQTLQEDLRDIITKYDISFAEVIKVALTDQDLKFVPNSVPNKFIKVSKCLIQLKCGEFRKEKMIIKIEE